MTGMDKVNDPIRRAAQPLCVKCGYDLSGLDPGGVCPECGAPVAGALRGDLLSAADPLWLRKVHRGLVLIGIGSIIVLLRLPAAALIHYTIDDFLDAIPLFWKVWEFVTGPLGVALLLVGVANVTTLDPRLSLSDQPIGLRRLTRWTAVGALIGVGLRAAFFACGDTSAGTFSVVYGALGDVTNALVACAAVGVTYYLACLAARLPDPALVARTRSNARLAGICFALAIIVAVIAPADLPSREGALMSVLMAVSAVAGLGSMVMAIALMVNWWAFRRPIRRCLAGG